MPAWITIPNLLSLSRILMTMIALYCLSTGLTVMAFILVLLTGLTDLLDGFMARYLNQVTDFGDWLDKFADKIFGLFFVIYFWHHGEIPLYYFGITSVRYGLELLWFSLRTFPFLRPVLSVLPREKRVYGRWEPGMLFFIIFFLSFDMVLGDSAPPIRRGIENIILPYIFLPLSGMIHLIVTARFFTNLSSPHEDEA